MSTMNEDRQIRMQYEKIKARWEAERIRDLSDLPSMLKGDELHKVTAEWIADLKPWKVYGTLTFRDPKEVDVAFSFWRRLVQVLNRDAFGNHYSRKVGHSYFSYILATEYQQREALHYHFLDDRPLNFDLIHSWWGAAAGFAWIEKVKDRASCIGYISKYILKFDQGLRVFENTKDREYTPLVKGPQGCFTPYWWVS